jgi:hypothetical protein
MYVCRVKFVSPAGRYPTALYASQATGTINEVIASKLSRCADVRGGGAYNNFWGAFIHTTQLNMNFVQLLKFRKG